MKKQFVWRMTALLLAMLMVLAVFAGCDAKKKEDEDEVSEGEEYVANTPEAVVRYSLLGLVKDLTQRQEIKPVVNMAQKGSLSLKADVNVKELMSVMGGSSEEGTLSAGGKIYFGDKALLLKDVFADVNVPSESIDFDIKADAYLSPDYIYVSNNNILGGTIGLVRGKMAESFGKFAETFGIPSEDAEMIRSILTLLDGNDLDNASAEITALVERYVKVVFDSLEKNASYVEATKNVTIDGQEVESRVVTMTVDEKAVVGIIKDLYNTVKNDTELRSMLSKYADLVGEYAGISGDEIVREFDEALVEIGRQMNNLDKEIPKGAIILEVATPAGKTTLRKLVVSGREGEAEPTVFLTLDAGKDGVKTSNRIELNIADEMIITYTVHQNDANKYEASMTLTETYRRWYGYAATKSDEEAEVGYQEVAARYDEPEMVCAADRVVGVTSETYYETTAPYYSDYYVGDYYATATPSYTGGYYTTATPSYIYSGIGSYEIATGTPDYYYTGGLGTYDDYIDYPEYEYPEYEDEDRYETYTETMTLFRVKVDKQTNAFTFSIPEGDFTLGGTLKTSDDTTTIVLNSITVDGEKLDRGFALTLVIDENDPMPAVVDKNNVKNIFDLSKGELVDIVDRFQTVFEAFFAEEKDPVAVTPIK